MTAVRQFDLKMQSHELFFLYSVAIKTSKENGYISVHYVLILYFFNWPYMLVFFSLLQTDLGQNIGNLWFKY